MSEERGINIARKKMGKYCKAVKLLGKKRVLILKLPFFEGQESLLSGQPKLQNIKLCKSFKKCF